MKKSSLLFASLMLLGVGAGAKTVKTEYKLTDSNFSNTLWGSADQNTVDTSTGKITYGASGNAVGWTFSPALDLTQYDKLVVKVKPQSVSYSGDWWVGVSLFLDVDGKGDNEVYMEKFNSATNNADSYFTREIDLTGTLKAGENHDGSEVSLTAVKCCTNFRRSVKAEALRLVRFVC